jgi:hypothetical protein
MTEQPPDSLIPYDEIVQEALRAVVGRVLGEVEASGRLPGEHHFYITFKTGAAGVDVALQFQAQSDEGAHDEHEAAENDPPVAEPIEDGSNVVSVDFSRKK